MKKIFLIISICLFSLGCHIAPNEKTNNSTEEKYNSGIKISFELKKYLPCFSVLDSKGTEYFFLFDSGYNYSEIFKSGLKKAGISKETEKLLRKSDMGITFNNEFYNPTQVFIYDEKNVLNKYADGIVGLDFFNAQKSLIVDYKNKCFVIDGDIFDGDVIPMTKEFFNLYTIPIEINNVLQKAVIDTGSEFFILSENYKSPVSKTDKEIGNFIYSNEPKIKTAFDLGEIIEIEYGTQKENVKAFHYYNKLLKVSSIGRRLSSEYCMFGYPMYMDKIIQFDFYNSNLIIKD